MCTKKVPREWTPPKAEADAHEVSLDLVSADQQLHAMSYITFFVIFVHFLLLLPFVGLTETVEWLPRGATPLS